MVTSKICPKIALFVFAVLGAWSPLAHAQSPYPDRPVRVVIPFPAGGAADVLARIVFEKASGSFGLSFVIENVAGAGGNLGTAQVAKAEPDGYKLVLSPSGPMAVNKTLSKNLPYDPETDLEPITLMAIMPNVVVVGKSVPVASFKELVEYVKARPGQINYSSIGNGSSQHLAGVFFEQLTGTKMTHVPYRAAGQMATDLVTGIVPLSFQLIPNVLGQLQSGDLRPLAVTAATRSPAQPDVPTTVELGMPGFISSAWFALMAPKGTPKPIIDKLHAAVTGAIKDPATNKRLIEIGADPATSTPAELRALIASEIPKWREIVTKGAVTVE